MKTVRDDDGKRYLLVKQSSDASLVRDPDTGNACYVRNDRLESIDGESPLEVAAAGVDAPIRRLVTAVHDDRTLGLLLTLADRGPTRVRELLETDGLCESDLHGTLAELTAAGVVEETTVDGERGYRVSDESQTALTLLRETIVESDDSAAESELDAER